MKKENQIPTVRSVYKLPNKTNSKGIQDIPSQDRWIPPSTNKTPTTQTIKQT